MKEWTLLCSGYSGEGEDMLLTRLTEEGDLLRTGGDRHGKNPSFCCSADKLVYAVSELPDGAAVDSYERGKGEIRHLGRIELPGRRGLCHLAAIGGVLYGSCYESGHFFALDLELNRVLWEYLPEGTPRAHWAQEMDGVLYLADLGNDRVYRFSLENGLPSGAPQPIRFPAGSGPRQPLSLGDGSFAVVCELDGMLRFFSRDGACLAELCASGRTGDNAPGGACRIGSVIFVGNRGPNTVSAFRITESGPVRVGEWDVGCWPRHMASVGEKLLLVACSRDDVVQVYHWNGAALKRKAELPLFQASCVLPLPERGTASQAC